ncbi:hypothetical protein [Natronoglomus mannanivorans]|uniref:Uncharacterized protein n=1 Tax=Natronoglomus mannanivorans TaxID=2979990 RepID=A0AAP3E1E4_9EURY|nr:hypothetical protein [Halobacteria archaeon AArc-xg1-1]
MPARDPDTDARSSSRSISARRRNLLAGIGVVGLAGVGTASGYRLLSTEHDTVDSKRTLAVDDEFDLEDVDLEPAGEDSHGSDVVSQECDPNPETYVSRNHTANLTLIDAWNERYRIWGERNASADDGDDNDSRERDENGVFVQNSVVVDKASERVDGSYLYGVRLHSMAHVESGRVTRHRLQRMENELAVDPEIEIRSVLPSAPIRPEDGVCTLTLLRELPSGWPVGYERSWWVDEGRIETDHDEDDDRVTLSFDGDVSHAVGMEGYLELRTDRPLSAFDDPFEWTIRGEGTRRGW